MINSCCCYYCRHEESSDRAIKGNHSRGQKREDRFIHGVILRGLKTVGEGRATKESRRAEALAARRGNSGRR